MKRWGLRIFVCLLLGVVTTVSVAWGCLLVIDQFPTATGRPMHDRMEWSDSGSEADTRLPSVREFDALWHHAYGPTPSYQYDRVHFGIRWARRTVVLFDLEWRTSVEYVKAFLVDESAGWPALAMSGNQFMSEKYPGWRIPNRTLALLATPGSQRQALPLRPIWPGFLIDTFFYAALWLGMIVGLGAARRTLRTRRGLCPMCKYDLRGCNEPGCPECGWNRSDDQPLGEAGG